MQPFKLLLEHPAYWSLHRRNVTRAFALGLFISFVPLPIHVALAAILALILRLNVPAAIAGAFFTNPLTMVPLFYVAYWVGCQLLGMGERQFQFQMSWDWLTTGLLPIWKPLLLGCLVMGTVTALAGYLILGGIWHVSLVMKYHSRKGASRARKSVNGEKCGE